MKKAVLQGSGFPQLSIIDSARNVILTFNEAGEVIFELPTEGGCFDFWHLPDGNYLYCHLGGAGRGITVVNPENEMVMRYLGDSEIFCCQPLKDGYFLAGELTEKRIAIIGPHGKLEEIVPIRSEVSGHEVMRSARCTANGDYLVVHPGDRCIRRYTKTGEVLAEFATRNDTFAVVEKTNGHLLYTAQTALAELDENGKEVWSMTAEEDFKGLGIHWFTGMQLLPDGNVVLVNWLGHGREGTGIPVLAVSPEKKVLWTMSAHDFTSDPANVQVGNITIGK